MVAECVGPLPGGPTHVLLNDRDAEPFPGATRHSTAERSLQAIGGFNGSFMVGTTWTFAGDCWIADGRSAFPPAAVVASPKSPERLPRQQRGYGKAEAMLNANGRKVQQGWRTSHGRGGSTPAIPTGVFGSRRGRIYQGTWGTALFQSVYQPAPNARCGDGDAGMVSALSAGASRRVRALPSSISASPSGASVVARQ